MAVPRTLAPSLGTPLHTSFGGAQALWWPCAAQARPKVFLIFVPGNPGLSSYYIPFLQTLHSSPALRGKLEILAVSHRGHAPVPPGTHSFFGPNDEAAKAAARGTGTDLDDQIAHKISVLDAVRAIYPREEDRDQEERGEGEEDVQVVLCGHSVGAYMSLEVMRARPGQVDGLHLLFPTLSWIGRTPNGTKLQPLFHPLVPTLLLPLPLLFLSLLPAMILLPLVQLLTAQPAGAARATADLLTTPGAVTNALKMARQEMRQIGHLREEVKEAVKTFAARPRKGGAIRTYWSRGDEDGWAPSWLRTEVESQLSLERLTLPAGIGTRAPVPTSSTFGPSQNGQNGTSDIDLSSAKATRKANGSIVLQSGPAPGLGSDEKTKTASAVASGGAALERQNQSSSFTSSTICDLGMPHAFCLVHGEQMAHITAHWLERDHLDA